MTKMNVSTPTWWWRRSAESKAAAMSAESSSSRSRRMRQIAPTVAVASVAGYRTTITLHPFPGSQQQHSCWTFLWIGYQRSAGSSDRTWSLLFKNYQFNNILDSLTSWLRKNINEKNKIPSKVSRATGERYDNQSAQIALEGQSSRIQFSINWTLLVVSMINQMRIEYFFLKKYKFPQKINTLWLCTVGWKRLEPSRKCRIELYLITKTIDGLDLSSQSTRLSTNIRQITKSKLLLILIVFCVVTIKLFLLLCFPTIHDSEKTRKPGRCSGIFQGAIGAASSGRLVQITLRIYSMHTQQTRHKENPPKKKNLVYETPGGVSRMTQI